jgi:hypothetical protein
MPDDKSRNYLLWGAPLTAFVVILLFAPIAAALLLPAIQQARETARREQTRRNLDLLRTALANYHNEIESLTPVAPADAGRPENSRPD